MCVSVFSSSKILKNKEIKNNNFIKIKKKNFDNKKSKYIDLAFFVVEIKLLGKG